MSEQKVEKKVVSRTVAIALGIICIVLALGLVEAIVLMNDRDITLTLGKSEIWVNDKAVNQLASSYVDWAPYFSASYAGYVSVNVQTSTSSNTYVRVIYSSRVRTGWVNYDNQIVVGNGGTAVFPILPSSNIDIRIGNTNLINGANETVTITYYY